MQPETAVRQPRPTARSGRRDQRDIMRTPKVRANAGKVSGKSAFRHPPNSRKSEEFAVLHRPVDDLWDWRRSPPGTSRATTLVPMRRWHAPETSARDGADRGGGPPMGSVSIRGNGSCIHGETPRSSWKTGACSKGPRPIHAIRPRDPTEDPAQAQVDRRSDLSRDAIFNT